MKIYWICLLYYRPNVYQIPNIMPSKRHFIAINSQSILERIKQTSPFTQLAHLFHSETSFAFKILLNRVVSIEAAERKHECWYPRDAIVHDGLPTPVMLRSQEIFSESRVCEENVKETSCW